jgi:excinuclease ABC subunit A
MAQRKHDVIEIRGARQHNLRIAELRIPKKKLVVVTGVSGSGKSSLAFDTLYAEGQRRYVESLSSYARQFLGQLDKPSYEHISGLSPTISINQKAASSNPRSTVGTLTEINDYLRVLYARLGEQYCPQCGKPVEALPTDRIVARLAGITAPVFFLAPLAENRKGTFRELLRALRERGYARVMIDGELRRLAETPELDKRRKHSLALVVERIVPSRAERSRIADSVETALREGQGTMAVRFADGTGTERRFNSHRTCSDCGLGLPELSPQLFSFNGPLGMCPECNGLGRRAEIDPDLIVPDASKSILDGAITPLASVMQRGSGLTFGIFEALQRELGIPLDKPWRTLSRRQQQLVLFGTGDRRVQVQWRGSHGDVAWPMQFEGVVRSMMRRFHETKSEPMRQYYARYMADAPCAECDGTRLRAESRAVRVAGATLPEVNRMSVGRARQHFSTMRFEREKQLIAAELLKEIVGRLNFLCSVGLDYLSLDRSGASLSGGEAQRLRLASQLGSELSGVLYVLDEPSIGLHQRDNIRLIRTLRQLRDADNTVLVVEHDAETIESADHVIDVGPGAGALGGQVVFCGTPKALKASSTLTGQYLAGRLRVGERRARRPSSAVLRVVGAAQNNLKGIDVDIPLGNLVAVTGVSGAGKSSLVAGILYPALCRALHGSQAPVGIHESIEGLEQIDKAIHIDQAPIGRTPRSNPATYTGAFDLIREIFALTPEARARGFRAGRFSFNVTGGRCDACQGDGLRRVEMHFLPDVFVACAVCHGQRYNEATLAVEYHGLNIAKVLDLSVAEALKLFAPHPRLAGILQTLSDVGLDYVRLGQPAPTLSGGEAQRVKLSRELARRDTGRTLYVLDEPTTGLHFDDVRRLLMVLDRLVASGNTVLVIEHNLDVIAFADHVIDLGPEGGTEGGRIVASGTPEQVAREPGSFTGRCLKAVLPGPVHRFH